MRPTFNRRLALLIAAFLALGALYAWVTPPWETPDEPWHMGYVAWLREEGSLPPLSLAALDTPVNQEASQPPLFYGLAALATLGLDLGEAGGSFVENPFRFGGVGLDSRNHTYALHGPWDDPAASAYIRGLRRGRLVALAMGALTVWATAQLGLALRPARPDLALAAAGLVAFNPQFLYLSGSVSNDTTAAAFSTLALWRALLLPRQPGARAALLLGLAMGLAWLSKGSALALGAVAALAVLGAAWESREQARARARAALRLGAMAFGVAALVGGWWYARNLIYFDSLMGHALHLAMPWARPSPVPLRRLLADHELWLLFVSYWAAFGWGTIRYPDWLYGIIRLVVAAAGLGLALGGGRWLRGRLARARRAGTGARPYGLGGDAGQGGDAGLRGDAGHGGDAGQGGDAGLRGDAGHGGGAGQGRDAGLRGGAGLGTGPDWVAFGYGLLALWCGLVLASLISWMRLVKGHWGRLYFPAIGAAAVLLVAGLDRLAPRRRLPELAVAALACLAIASPWLALRPALRPPPSMAMEAARAEGEALGWRFGDLAELVSVRLGPREAAADSGWPLRTCWRALAPGDRQYAMFVHLVRPVDQVGAGYHSIPADGTFPAPAWRAGDLFCDTAYVILGEEVPPGPYQVLVGLFDPATQERLPVLDARGNPLGEPRVGQVKVVPAEGERFPAVEIPRALPATRWEEPAAWGNADAPAGALRLAGYDLEGLAGDRICPGQPFTLTLFWQPEAPLAGDYPVFVHLRPEPAAPDAPPLAQADGPARLAGATPEEARDYPSGLWSAGETVVDQRPILPPADLADGRYALSLGLYRLDDFARLPVTVDGRAAPGDQVGLPALQVEGDCG